MKRLGYLNKDAKVDSMVSVVKKCNLGIDGTCNNETLSFDERPRCGFEDKVLTLLSKTMTKGYTKGIT